jgi:hypothetical protein
MKRIGLVAGLLGLMIPQLALAQNQLFVGTWKANIAKSKYDPGPGPRSETLQVEAVGDGIKMSLKGVNERGLYVSEATGKFDGVDVPVAGSPLPQGGVLTDAFRLLDARTWEIVIKMNGVPQIEVRNIVSEDGKSMRSISTVVKGARVNQVVIYEKQ